MNWAASLPRYRYQLSYHCSSELLRNSAKIFRNYTTQETHTGRNVYHGTDMANPPSKPLYCMQRGAFLYLHP